MSNKKDKNMSQIKQALTKAKEIADEFQNTHSDDCFARAHYSCQSWILGKMIRITDTLTRARRDTQNKQK